MAIIGGIFLIVSVVLFFVRLSKLKQLACIRSARLATASDIHQVASAVAQDIGSGSWQDYVKVYGKIVCDQPIHSQVKKVACVYYKTKVTREYEEIVTRKDDQGRTIKKTERQSEVVSQTTLSTPFWLADATGKIKIHPEDANIETIEILSEFRPETQRSSRISFGGFSLTTNTHHNARGRTLGYRYKESILPVDREALIIGMANDMTSLVTIRKPSENKQQFIIALKTEGELVKNVSGHVQQVFYAMLGCLGVGTALLAVDLFS
ncbi:E3 ubiquitin ligase family protein [cf. Phormidesmis sp. LEGE 11477]|uniref:E3 ubiquitin ligase family protein n=1 Tax=cf. Phormidesmis sp. LEGE 11477 TaxID=1828680 RepID=UPI001881F431|nr:E3 ubiquitin ligase family protein [cf. Phormidesmis sp. LEGE 11477]MBE9063593.1 E3 ubiquitin ligase family protein [cf. Phormidesmis sp. LEGE 11477]